MKMLEFRYNLRAKSNKCYEKIVKNRVVNGILNGLYPLDFTCNYCNKEMENPSRSGLCSDCEKELKYNDNGICITCGRPLDSETNYCLSCQNTKRYFEFARSPLVYDGICRKLIYQFKFNNKKYLAKYFASLMVDTFLSNPYTVDLITYVPVSKSKLVSRGYNQSELLAKELGEKLKIDVLSAITKNKETVDQVGLSGKERAENLRGAFAVSKELVKGKNILLVDDVLTTGSTCNEVSRMLVNAGAKSVKVLVIASVEERIYLS